MSDQPISEGDVVTRRDVELALEAMTKMRDGEGATEDEIEKVVAEVRRWKVGTTLYEFMCEGLIDITVNGEDVMAQMKPETHAAIEEASRRAGS